MSMDDLGKADPFKAARHAISEAERALKLLRDRLPQKLSQSRSRQLLHHMGVIERSVRLALNLAGLPMTPQSKDANEPAGCALSLHNGELGKLIAEAFRLYKHARSELPL